jgi:hypothetical protein
MVAKTTAPAETGGYKTLEPRAHPAREQSIAAGEAARQLAPLASHRDFSPAASRDLSDLIGELSTRSDEFRVRWAAHHVRIHTTGVKLIHHPVVGNLELAFESFPLGADPSQNLLTYTAEPGSPSQDALSLLASWAASTAHGSHASTHQNDQQERQEDRQHDPGHDLRSGSASLPGDA